MVAFASRDFSAVEPAAYGDFNALDARLCDLLNLLFNRSSVRYALFKLRGDRFCDELRVLLLPYPS